MFLKKETKYIAYTTLAAAIVNILLNFLLIPHFAMFGAATATLLSFLFLFLISYRVSNRLYSVPYEVYKIFKMVAVVLGLYAVSVLSFDLNTLIQLMVKVGLLAVFPIALYYWKFYESIEIRTIAEWIRVKPVKRFILKNFKAD